MTALAEERLLADQHAIVVRTVRVMAGDAALADRRMLPEIRAALVGVAARAALVDGRAGTQQPEIGAAVDVVAGRAGQGALPHRHVVVAVLPLRDVAMALAAQLRLGACAQPRLRFRRVDVVARGATERPLIVLAAFPQCVRGAVVTRE